MNLFIVALVLLGLAVVIAVALPWWRRKQAQDRRRVASDSSGWWVPATAADCEGKDLADPTNAADAATASDSGCSSGDGGGGGGE